MRRPTPAQLSFTGINRDQIAGIVPPDWWTEGRNVFFKAGKTCRTPGEAPFATPPFKQAKFIHFVDVGAQEYWIYGGDNGIAVTDGTTTWDVTPTGGTGWAPMSGKNRKFTVGDLNGVPFVNHPEVGPFWWNGDVATRFQLLPGWPAGWTCEAMRAHKNFLMAMTIGTATGLLESQLSWSDSADPGQIPSTWAPSPTNDAGDYQVGGPSGPIMDGLSVRDQFLVAKKDFTVTMQYVGGQFVFEARDLFPSTGLFATGAWCEVANQIYMLTGNGKFIRHDMTSFEDLLYGVLEEYFRKQLNWEYPNSCFAYRDNEEGQIVFCYPTGTDKACMEAITIEVATGRPGIRDLPSVWAASSGFGNIVGQQWDTDSATWDSDTTTWSEQASGYQPKRVVFGAGSYGLLMQGTAQTQIVAGVAQPMQAYVSRKGIDGGDWDYRKTISGLVPRLTGQPGDVIYLQLSARQTDDGADETTAEVAFRIGSGQEQADLFIDGRLAGMQARSDGGSQWQLSQMIPQGRRSGRW